MVAFKAAGVHRGYAAAHRPVQSDGDADFAGPNQSQLDRGDRQRRRHRVSNRALPGRRLHDVRRDRGAGRHGDDVQRHTGLSANTSYSYRVRATDAARNLGAVLAARHSHDAGAGHEPPSAPGTLTATAISGTQIDLVGTRRPTTSASRAIASSGAWAQAARFVKLGTRHRHHLQRHGSQPEHELQLHRAAQDARRQSGTLLERRHRDDAGDESEPGGRVLFDEGTGTTVG